MEKLSAVKGNYSFGINTVLASVYCTVIFFLWMLVKGNSISQIVIFTLLAAAVFFFLSPFVMQLLNKISIKKKGLPEGKLKKLLLISVFFLVPFLSFLIRFIGYYPGAFTAKIDELALTDCIMQIEQIRKGAYIDWHPVIHTLLVYKLPYMLFGKKFAAIVFLQILFFAIAICYALVSITVHTNKWYAIAAMLYIVLNPQTGNFSVMPIKDVSFTIGTLFLTSFCLHIYFSKGEWIKNPLNMLAFIVIAALTCLFRHNAVLFIAPLLFAVCFFIKPKRALLVILGILVIIAGIKYPLYSALEVLPPDSRQTETLGLPMTVISAVTVNDPEALDGEMKEFVYSIAPPEMWKKDYVEGSFNEFKYDSETKTEVIEEYGAKKVLSYMVRCFKASPKISLRALIKLTEVTYTVFERNEIYIVPLSHEGLYGLVNIKAQGVEKIRNLNEKYSKALLKYLPHLFEYVGALHLLLLFSVLKKFKINSLSEWKKLLLAMPIFVYNFGTMLLLTTMNDGDRFFLYTFLTLPVLLPVFYAKNNQTEEEYEKLSINE